MSPVGALYDTFTKANGHPSSLKLRFDSSLIDDGPCRFDFPLVELVEHVLSKAYLAPINLKAEETSLGRAVKSQAARDVRRLADQEVNVEMKVRDFTKIWKDWCQSKYLLRRGGSFRPFVAAQRSASWVACPLPIHIS